MSSLRIRLLPLLLLALCAALPAHALDNGLGKTPPMGWNSWNKFACKGLNEKVVKESADTMVASGMKDAGYQYILLDDCWQSARDAQGNILADPEHFPHGIKAVADYVHSKGLKFGLYTDVGTQTCAGRPGSLGHEYQDAMQYAAWGVDYLKEDWCHTLPGQSAESSYTLMRNALAEATAKTGRPIFFSLCEWGSNKPWLWAGPIGNMWRATGDIQDCWSCKKDWGGNGVTAILDLVDPLYSYAGPGHFNDPDMLEVGNGGLTTEENRAHFSMWALLAAPLLAGNDIANMSADTRSILLNKEVIAVDQDPMGIQGHRIKHTGGSPTPVDPTTAKTDHDKKVEPESEFANDQEVWVKQMADGGRTVVLLNRGPAPAQISATWPEIGYPADLPANVRDLWAAKDLGKLSGSYSATVPSHGVVMLRIKP
jgi:alpha-galactosidase